MTTAKRELVWRVARGILLVVVATAAFLAVTFLASHHPICPQEHRAFISDEIYCTSFRWSVVHQAVVSFACALGFLLLPRLGRLLRASLVSMPLGFLLLVLWELSEQALDRVCPETADKVEFHSLAELPIAWCLVLTAIVVVEVVAWRRRRA